MAEWSPNMESEDQQAFLKRLGNGNPIEWDAAGRAVMEFTADPEQCHSGGIVQGGYVSGWIDNAMAIAAITMAGGTQNISTIELKVSFFRPALVGVTYRAESWVERAGKSIAFMEGKLTDPEGRIVAKASSSGRWLDMLPTISATPAEA